MRAQRQWHADREARQAAKRATDAAAYAQWHKQRDAVAWTSLVEPCEIDGWAFTPLVCGKDLKIEGQTLDHCVADYADHCLRGESRVFSLARGEERATVEIAPDDATWRVQQVFGYRNADCSEAVWKAARKLAKLYAQRERQSKATGFGRRCRSIPSSRAREMLINRPSQACGVLPEAVDHCSITSMSQRSFASAEYAMENKRTRREKFLSEMERVVPWSRLLAVSEPLSSTSGRVGRQPIGVARMLRMYCLQQWYALADEALEDALYDSQALRDFV